jgi:hypothetical protein
MVGYFWAHPERVLDQHARDAMSGLARTIGNDTIEVGTRPVGFGRPD